MNQVDGSFVTSGKLRIWTERFGDPAAPAVLLVMGTSAQGIMWPDELVDVLVKGGFQVVRFDHRDTGRSDDVDFETDPYTIADMAGDTLAVLDGHGIGAAHLVGVSLGGTVCQWLAVHHPERVRTLTAIMTSPMGNDQGPAWQRALAGQEPDPDDLPGPAPRFLRHLAERAGNPPTTREERISSAVDTWRVLHGSVLPFDEDAARHLVETSYDRTRRHGAAEQHNLAGQHIGDDRLAPLSAITVPTLVIHGTEDPIFPPRHGEALAARIPHARLQLVHGMGHGFFAPGLPRRVAELLLEHMTAA